MKFGFDVPAGGLIAAPDLLITLAKRGEEMGFDFMSMGDHIVMPRSVAPLYPYSESGLYPDEPDYGNLEQLTTLSFLASQTSRLRLLTGVMVVPYRAPVFTAKILASIDVLSGGRLIVGCGVGWMQEEFDALEAPPFEERGAVSDEYIQAFKELWTSKNPTFDGKYCHFSNLAFVPKPHQKPHPPIWIGGESPAALRRVARLGDAWLPIGSNPRFPVETPDQYSEYLSRLHRYAEEVGRDPSSIDLAYEADRYNDNDAETLPNGQRRVFTGTPTQIADDIKGFQELGVRHISFGFLPLGELPEGGLDALLATMESFAARVRPLVEGG